MITNALTSIFGAYLPSVDPAFFDVRIGEGERVIYTSTNKIKLGMLLSEGSVKVAVEKKNGFLVPPSVGVTVLVIPGAHKMPARELIDRVTAPGYEGVTVAHTSNLGGATLDREAVGFLRFLGLLVKFCAAKIPAAARRTEVAEIPAEPKRQAPPSVPRPSNVVSLKEYRPRRR